MTTGFSNALRVEELKKRLLFTAGMMAVYRVGVAIPTPGIDGAAMQSFFQASANDVFGLVNLFSFLNVRYDFWSSRLCSAGRFQYNNGGGAARA